MRHPALLTGFLTGLVLLMPAAAPAQVTIDLRALEALPQAPPPSAPPTAHPAPRQVLRTVPASRAAAAALPVPPGPPPRQQAVGQEAARQAGSSAIASPTTPAAPAMPMGAASAPAPVTATVATPTAPAPPTAPTSLAPAPPPATLPSAPPPVATLAPIAPPTAPTTTTPPAPPPVSAASGTTAAPEKTGLSLVFIADELDLSPAATAAIDALVKATPSGSTITFNVVAYAKGAADDPSAARRTSLARGLSVRAALIADGVASTHIYVRALGASSHDGPADRVDLTVLGASGIAATPEGTKPAASARP